MVYMDYAVTVRMHSMYHRLATVTGAAELSWTSHVHRLRAWMGRGPSSWPGEVGLKGISEYYENLSTSFTQSRIRPKEWMTQVAPTRTSQWGLCQRGATAAHASFTSFIAQSKALMQIENSEPPDIPADAKSKDAPAAVHAGPIVIDWADNDPQVRLTSSRVRESLLMVEPAQLVEDTQERAIVHRAGDVHAHRGELHAYSNCQSRWAGAVRGVAGGICLGDIGVAVRDSLRSPGPCTTERDGRSPYASA